MTEESASPTTVDEYLAGLPDGVREKLQQIRAAVQDVAPEAQETISYKMPAYLLKGRPLVYFSAHTHHIGLYPAPRDSAAFRAELSGYKGGKGTVQFPLDEPVPLDLIRRIVTFRVHEILGQAQSKGKKS